MTALRLQDLSKSFDGVPAVRNVDMKIGDGEMLVLVGPSGCGKSTLLRLIAGLEEATSGRIFIGDDDVTATPAAERGLSMVFQNYALYPHKTVAENMGFALKVARRPAAEIAERVARAAEILNLGGLLERRPAQLSGGQRQRVAIGRAIVREPRAFLFDEPLSNLDAALRAQTRVEIARLHRRLGATMIYVTHDQVEAMTLADRIAVLAAGRIEQLGAPLDLYESPANMFVASFLGSPQMNILPCSPAEGNGKVLLPGGVVAETSRPLAAGTAAHAGIRPEHVELSNEEGDTNIVPGRVALAERLGADTFLHVDAEDCSLVARAGARSRAAAGDEARLHLSAAHLHLFDEDGRALTRGEP